MVKNCDFGANYWGGWGSNIGGMFGQLLGGWGSNIGGLYPPHPPGICSPG